MDINRPHVYTGMFFLWLLSLDEGDRSAIQGEVIERHYPDGFNGFVHDCEADAVKTGEDHG